MQIRRYQGSFHPAYDGTVIVESLCFCDICKKSDNIKLEIVVRMRGKKYTLRHVNPSSVVNRHV